MNGAPLKAFWQALPSPATRRGLLAAAVGGLLTSSQLVNSGIESEAKKKRNGRGRRKNNRKKKDRTQTQVDAICPGPTDNTGLSIDDDARPAQTFTALRSGRLMRAELLIFAGTVGSADLTLQLRDINASGVPTDEVLAESTVFTSEVPNGENTVVFAFADSPSVVANREYALVLSGRGPRTVSWKGHRNASCDGRALISEPSSEPFEPQVDDLDLIFTTVVKS